jgi:hypothetical protein
MNNNDNNKNQTSKKRNRGKKSVDALSESKIPKSRTGENVGNAEKQVCFFLRNKKSL